MTRITGTRRFAALCMTLAAGAFSNTAWAISASLTAPAAGAVFQAGATITLTATATPTNSSRPIVKVEFFRGTTLIGTDTTSPYSFAWTNVPAGSYSLTAKATDSTGATATSAARSIKVNAPPTVNLTAPANNAVFNSGSTIALAATAADSDGTISKVEFFRGATLIGSDTTSPYSFNWTNVAAGTYVLTAKATDSNAAVTTSAAVNITVDTPPTVSITAPANNAVFLPATNVTVTASAADADGTVASVDFLDGATLVGSVVAPGPFTTTLSNLAAGTHTLTARATDNLGRSTTSAAVAIRVDAAPTVSITSPANNAVFTPPANITVTATAADTDGTVMKVDFFDGATLVGTVNGAPPYSVTLANAAAGTHTLTARATDNNGAVTTSAAVSVVVDAAPTVSITSPANNAAFTAPASIAITATATDSDGSIAKVEFFQGTTLLGTATFAPYTFTWSNVPAGSYSLTAKATDNQGAATTSAAVAVTVSAAPSFGSWVDGADCSTVSGWAWDRNRPNTPISVDIYSDAVLVATVLAGNFRQDLLNAGIGDGNHGFSIATPSAAITGQPHTINVKFSGTQILLDDSGWVVNCIAPGVPTPVYSGWLESASCAVISGWAWNSKQPNSPINVEVYSDGVLLTSVPANQFRQDLANAGIGNGVHGFSFATPNSLRNLATQTHLLEARFPGVLSACPPIGFVQTPLLF